MDTQKKRRGRPRGVATIETGLRIEIDLYGWLTSQQDGKSLNQRINDIIRYYISQQGAPHAPKSPEGTGKRS